MKDKLVYLLLLLPLLCQCLLAALLIVAEPAMYLGKY